MQSEAGYAPSSGGHHGLFDLKNAPAHHERRSAQHLGIGRAATLTEAIKSARKAWPSDVPTFRVVMRCRPKRSGNTGMEVSASPSGMSALVMVEASPRQRKLHPAAKFIDAGAIAHDAAEIGCCGGRVQDPASYIRLYRRQPWRR